MEINLHYTGITEIIVTFATISLSFAIIIFFLVKGKKSAELYSYIIFEFVIFLWLACDFFAVLLWYFFHPLYDKYIFLLKRFYEIPLNFIHLSWLVFVLYFTNNRQRKNKKLIISLFLLNSLLFVAAMIAWNYLDKGVNINLVKKIFGLCAVPVYVEFFVATFLLLKYTIKQLGNSRRQAILVMIGASLPVLAKLIQDIGNWTSTLYIKYDMPVIYLIEVLLINVAVFRYRFLNIVPIALRNLVDNMQPAILVIDMSNRIADTNASFNSNFSTQGVIKINDNVDVFGNAFKDIVDNIEVLSNISNKDIYYYNGELGIRLEAFDGQLQWKYYTVNIQPVITRRKKILGRIVLFNDVTEYKTLVENLNEKNIQLVNANEQLKEYAATVEELTVVKERNRFARDVHDTIGHSLTLVVALLSVARLEIKTNLDNVHEKINKAINIARDGMQEIRCSVAGLTVKNINIKYLVDTLEVICANFKNSGIDADLECDILDKSVTSISPVLFDTICKLYKEILTNSLKHGKATKVVSRFEVNGVLRIVVSDNGIGCENIVKGFGLSGMEQRVGDLKGSVHYGTDGEKGFNVTIELPAC